MLLPYVRTEPQGLLNECPDSLTGSHTSPVSRCFLWNLSLETESLVAEAFRHNLL